LGFDLVIYQGIYVHTNILLSNSKVVILTGFLRVFDSRTMAYSTVAPHLLADVSGDAFRRCDSNETFVDSDYSGVERDTLSNLKTFMKGDNTAASLVTKEYLQGSTPLKIIHCPKSIVKADNISPKLWNYVQGPDFQIPDCSGDKRYLYKNAETNVVINGISQRMKSVFQTTPRKTIDADGRKTYRFFLQILNIRLKTKIEDAYFTVQVGTQSYTTNAVHCAAVSHASKYCYSSDVHEGFIL
jgi:hypothetical protein